MPDLTVAGIIVGVAVLGGIVFSVWLLVRSIRDRGWRNIP